MGEYIYAVLEHLAVERDVWNSQLSLLPRQTTSYGMDG